MKKIFIFILFIFVEFALTSCDWLVKEAEAEVIGIGNIQQGKGGFYVEIDSLCYVPNFIFTNQNRRNRMQEMAPTEGMQVTCFRLYGEPKVYFIAGAQSEGYLEEYFTENYWVAFAFLVFLVITVVIVAVREDKRWREIFNKD